MIKSVTVTNHLGESIKLELGRPEKSGLSILSIDGLGPGKASINMTDMATNDGAVYNSARVSTRNIVFHIGLMDLPTAEDTRQKTYKYFPLKKFVKLLFETDNRTCYIHGYVESNDPDIFSRTETTQISIICPDPYFYSQEEMLTIFSGVESLFEAEFSNESLTENLIEFGAIQNKTTQTVNYKGDTETGMTITLHALGEVRNITIYNIGTRESMKINTDRLTTMTGFPIIAGDTITISTVKGSKCIFLLRDGSYINILNCLDKNVDWFELSKGDNLFTYNAEYGNTSLQFWINNRLVYGGI
jgi:hypothetical protein